MMPLSAGFLGDLPLPLPLHSGAAQYSPQSPSSAHNTSVLRAAKISSHVVSALGCARASRFVVDLPQNDPGCTAARQLTLEFSMRCDFPPSNIDITRGAAVAERLACSTPTRANRVQSPAGFSQVGIVPDDAAGRRVFSGISRLPHTCILAHSRSISYSSALKTSLRIQVCNPTHKSGFTMSSHAIHAGLPPRTREAQISAADVISHTTVGETTKRGGSTKRRNRLLRRRVTLPRRVVLRRIVRQEHLGRRTLVLILGQYRDRFFRNLDLSCQEGSLRCSGRSNILPPGRYRTRFPAWLPRFSHVGDMADVTVDPFEGVNDNTVMYPSISLITVAKRDGADITHWTRIREYTGSNRDLTKPILVSQGFLTISPVSSTGLGTIRAFPSRSDDFRSTDFKARKTTWNKDNEEPTSQKLSWITRILHVTNYRVSPLKEAPWDMCVTEQNNEEIQSTGSLDSLDITRAYVIHWQSSATSFQKKKGWLPTPAGYVRKVYKYDIDHRVRDITELKQPLVPRPAVAHASKMAPLASKVLWNDLRQSTGRHSAACYWRERLISLSREYATEDQRDSFASVEAGVLCPRTEQLSAADAGRCARVNVGAAVITCRRLFLPATLRTTEAVLFVSDALGQEPPSAGAGAFKRCQPPRPKGGIISRNIPGSSNSPRIPDHGAISLWRGSRDTKLKPIMKDKDRAGSSSKNSMVATPSSITSMFQKAETKECRKWLVVGDGKLADSNVCGRTLTAKHVGRGRKEGGGVGVAGERQWRRVTSRVHLTRHVECARTRDPRLIVSNTPPLALSAEISTDASRRWAEMYGRGRRHVSQECSSRAVLPGRNALPTIPARDTRH
ncbi:hypothetical protein PR048_022547 [Dryococelus australis]|uniref:Uncharacterized protein n=1 Tax=Dryococelus australis TaxID=614101 RepID=A0ABQ9H1A4_9NEOP|nr:hypothetical protein PR048_022547 [Dryococelus australis]